MYIGESFFAWIDPSVHSKHLYWHGNLMESPLHVTQNQSACNHKKLWFATKHNRLMIVTGTNFFINRYHLDLHTVNDKCSALRLCCIFIIRQSTILKKFTQITFILAATSRRSVLIIAGKQIWLFCSLRKPPFETKHSVQYDFQCLFVK